MPYITAQQAAEKWGVSLRYVQRLMSENRISGAKKYGRSWMIPADAENSTYFATRISSSFFSVCIAVLLLLLRVILEMDVIAFIVNCIRIWISVHF